MEAANALFLPALALWFGWPQSLAGGLVLLLAIVAVVIGLAVGAMYWLALDARLQGHGAAAMARALPLAAAAQRPMLATTLAAVLGSGWLILTHGWSLPHGVAASVALLAGLEYVNYYHVQLQHFDNAADLKRLLSGKGLRKAHLARDLARWRRRIIRS